MIFYVLAYYNVRVFVDIRFVPDDGFLPFNDTCAI